MKATFRPPPTGGRKSDPGAARAVRRRAFGALAFAVILCLPARPGTAYRFYDFEIDVGPTPPSAYALRWDTADLPLTYRLVENDYGPDLPRDLLRDIVEEGFELWNNVATSAFRAELADEPHQAVRMGVQGINQVGIADFFVDAPFLPAAALLYVNDATTIRECDIYLSPHLGRPGADHVHG